jgi:hypothetical protein
MKKILIKTNLQQLSGLNYHRLIVPYTKVSDLLEFKCDVYNDPHKMSDEQLQVFDAIVYQREIDIQGRSPELIKRYQSLGLKVIFDIDDYWILPSTHWLHRAYKEHKISEQTIEILKLVDLVTCTTSHLAKEVSRYNTNVEVLPNCLDTSEEQWKQNKVESNKLRFGYVAGVHHVEDVRLMVSGIKKALFKLDCQFVLGGYNNNPHYNYYESVMSCNGVGSSGYKRIDALPVTEYGIAYNYIDVSLIPLASSVFTPFKSEIKMLEAGVHRNAVIVQNALPYNTLPKNVGHWINDESDWYKAFRKMISEPGYRQDKADALEYYTRTNYDIIKWTETRKQILRLVLG